MAHVPAGVPFPPGILQQHDAAWGEVPHLAITDRSLQLACQNEDKLSSWRWVRRTIPSGRKAEEPNLVDVHERGQLHRWRGWGEIGQGHGDFDVFEVRVAMVVGIDTNVFHCSPPFRISLKKHMRARYTRAEPLAFQLSISLLPLWRGRRKSQSGL